MSEKMDNTKFSAKKKIVLAQWQKEKWRSTADGVLQDSKEWGRIKWLA